MALINPTIPTIGQPNSSEDQDIVNAFNTIVSAINGGLDTANLAAGAGITGAQLAAAAGITASQLATAVQAAAGLNGASTRRGRSIIATEEARTDTAYGLMATPDRVSGIVMPASGLIFVGYQALWKESAGSNAARAAVFLGSNQLRSRDGTGAVAVQETSHGSSSANVYLPLGSHPGGLASGGGNISVASDVTTGQIVGEGNRGLIAIHAAAGTYDVSVQFKASSGSVTAKERKLWVWSQAFE